MTFLNVIMKDILGTPAILIGLFAFIGLVAQKKESSEVISGTLKTIMGFVVLGAGAGVIVGSLGIFGQMFDHAFGIKGIIPNNESVVALAQKTLGKETALIMVLGMVFNILIAKFTKFKYIFLTGHHTLFMACLISAILSVSGISGVGLVVGGGVLLGTLMVLSPAMLQKYTKEITGTDDLALGHFGSVGYFVSANIGKMFGNKAHSTESINVPKNLSFLRDTSVSISLTMSILFFIVSIFAGKEFVETTVSGGSNFIVFSFLKAIEFAAGLISLFLLPLFHLSVIVPGLIPHFFCGATAGVYGNITGGKRGAILGSFVHGMLISFLPALVLPLLAKLGFEGTTFGDADFATVGLLLGNAGKQNSTLIYVVIAILLSIPFVLTMIKRDVKKVEAE